MKIVRDSAVRQEPAQPQAVSPEENRFSIRPRQIALFFLWMLAFTLLARGTSGALLPEVQLSTPAPNTITQSLTATGTIQWAAGSLFYLPEGLLVEAVFVSEGEAVQEGDKIAALRREDVEQMRGLNRCRVAALGQRGRAGAGIGDRRRHLPRVRALSQQRQPGPVRGKP